jgi:hypothetical protein
MFVSKCYAARSIRPVRPEKLVFLACNPGRIVKPRSISATVNDNDLRWWHFSFSVATTIVVGRIWA